MTEIERAIHLISEIYAVSCVGGPLHTLIDDGNVFDYCLRLNEDWHVPDGPYCDRYTDEQVERANRAAEELLTILQPMTEDQRSDVLRAYRYRSRP